MAGTIAEVVLRVKADASQVPAVSSALQDVEQDAERAAASLKDMGDSAGHVGQSSAKLAGSLSMLSPEVGGAALAIADLADVGEVATAAAAALGVSLGTLAVAALPIAAIVAAVAVAWDAHTEAAKLSEEAMAEAARTADGTAKAMEGLGRVVRDNLIRQKELSGEYTAVQADAIRAGASIADSYLPALQAQTHELELSKQRLEEYVATRGQRSLLENTYADKTEELTAEVEKQRGEVTRLNTAYKDALVSQDANIKATGKAKEEQKAETAATKAHTEAIKEQATYSPSAAAFEGAADERIKFWADNAAALEAAGDRREAAFIADTEQTQAWAAAQAEAADKAAAAAAKAQGNVTGGINAGASGVSGGMSALSSAGPIGAIIAAVVGAIQAIGNGLLDQVHAEVMTFISTVGDLPEVISAAMERSMSDTIPALMEAIPKFIESAIRSLPQTLAATLGITATRAIVAAIGEWWSSVGGLQGLGQSVVEALGRWWRDAWAAVRDFLKHPLDRDQDGRRLGGEAIDASKRAMSFLWSGEFATGTDYVPRTGLALVHQGERIETARGNGGGMGARTAAGGDVHLHLSGFAVGTADQLIRELNKHLGAGNRRLSWSG